MCASEETASTSPALTQCSSRIRCKKPLYYAVVIAAAVAIWAVFRFGLGVLF